MPDPWDVVSTGAAPVAPQSDPWSVVKQTPSTWAKKLGLDEPGHEVSKAVVDAAEGLASGAAGTVFHGGELIRHGLNALGIKTDHPINNPEVQQAMTAPPGIAGTVGQIGEHALELAGGSGIASGLTRGLAAGPELAALGQAVAGGGTAALQSGGNPSAVASSAIAGGAGSLIGSGLSALSQMSPKNVNSPVQEQALQWAENKGIPMSLGQRSGQLGMQRMEQGLENVPGAASKAQQFYQDQQDALAQAGSDVSKNVSPTLTNDYGAGQGVMDRLTQRIGRLKTQADKFYDQVRSGAAANSQQVQVGTKTSPLVTAAGAPITTPIMQTLESPVDLDPIRQQLQPVWDDINRLMPEAKKAYSPAYSAMKDLMETQSSQMNAMDFDKYLGAVKALARDGESPYLTGQSQALAKQVVAQGEQQLAQALPADLYNRLNSGRGMVKSYYNTADLLGDINNSQQEPGVLYNNLTRGGDRVVDTLRQLQKVAPKEVQTVGRTFIEDMLNKATNNGGFNSRGLMGQWNRMGPETKGILFGQQAPEIDQFMQAARALTENLNPSGSAKVWTALRGLGAGGMAMWSLITGNPIPAAAFGAGVTGARLLADTLFTPGAARSVVSAVAPLIPKAAVAASAGANAALGSVGGPEPLPEAQ